MIGPWPTDSGGRAKALWITETGMLLNSRSRSGGCPAAGTDPAGTLGACINGNGPAQAADIISFFALARAGGSVPITHVFWYEWQGEPNWDSGLTDATGAPRPIWCAFFGSGDCGAARGRVLTGDAGSDQLSGCQPLSTHSPSLIRVAVASARCHAGASPRYAAPAAAVVRSRVTTA